MKIIEYTNNSHTDYLPNRTIKYIVVHYTAGVSSSPGSAKNTIDSIYINGNTNVSADFTIDQSGAYLYNGDIKNRYTWHCGGSPDTSYGGAKFYNKCTNKNSIGIEVCSDNNSGYILAANTGDWSYNQTCINILVELIQYLMKEYNIDIDHVIRHFDVTGKLCPGIIGWNTGPIKNRNDSNTDQINNENAWLEFKKRVGGSKTNTSSTANCGYYYHPLGDLAKAFVDGTASSSEFPHTYDNNGDHAHGVGNLDWGSGSSIPQLSPVYSMTDGTIYTVYTSHGDGGRGVGIYIKTDRLDGAGKPICIHYIELSGVSDRLAQILGCEAGPHTESEFASFNVSSSEPISVKMGELIGYTNDWYLNYSNMHTDFTYEGVGDNNSTDIPAYIEASPHVKNVEQLNKKFSVEKTGQSIPEYIVKCDGKIVGSDNGMVRLQSAPSSYYPVYPFISYLVCQQIPVYLSGGSSSSMGAIGQYAPEGYDTIKLSCSDNELLHICNTVLGEIGYNSDSLEAARSGILLYAKLIRCRAILNNEDVMTVINTGGFYGHTGTYINTSTISSLQYTQEEFLEKVRQNYCNPELYDITDTKCVQIAKAGPYYNYGYSPDYNYPCTSSIETELENRIRNGEVKSHMKNSLGTNCSNAFLGCIGNTGYWAYE